MKRNHHFIALAVVTTTLAVAGCKAVADTGDATTSTASAKVARVELVVEGMTCAACNVTVAAAAKSVGGVTATSANTEKKRAWVTYDPDKTSVEAIATAITLAGYSAKRVPNAASSASKNGA